MKESRFNIWVDREDDTCVFNGSSGALLRMPLVDARALQPFLAGETGADYRPNLLADLVRGRMVIPDDLDERVVLRQRYRVGRYDTSQLSLTLLTSLGCNFDCPYCFEAKHPSIMDDEVEAAILQLVDDRLPTIQAFNVSWFGGEPLVGKQPLLALSDAFIERCDRHGVAYSADIVTNGYLLDEDTCRQLRDRRVLAAQITIDGPPDVHNRMRPLAGGKPSFDRIVHNLHHATEYLQISVRINTTHDNYGRVEELLQILAGEGFAGKLEVYVAQLTATDTYAPAPSASFQSRCFTQREYAQVQIDFAELAERYGFGSSGVPTPKAAPCTAVRAHDLIVGSHGELYKCWESVGNPLEVVGNIRDYTNLNGRLHKWLQFDPFSDPECQTCIALPVCMGGCAVHAMDPKQHDNRCITFRYNYREQVLRFVDHAERTGTVGVGSARALARPMDTR